MGQVVEPEDLTIVDLIAWLRGFATELRDPFERARVNQAAEELDYLGGPTTE